MNKRPGLILSIFVISSYFFLLTDMGLASFSPQNRSARQNPQAKMDRMENKAISALAQTSDVVVTVDRGKVIGTSSFSPGIVHMDDSLQVGDPLAISRVKDLLRNGLVYQSTFIMAWGMADPWPDPASPEPTQWGYLDQRLALMQETNAIPIISLMNAPWWMKGQLKPDGTTQLIPDINGEWASHIYNTSITDFRGFTYPAGYTSPDPFFSRILDNQIEKWVHLVRRVAERYMVPPYNVRYFQVWNELKGYYNGALNRWDYENQAGVPGSFSAKHGYTYLYNRVYQVLREVASAKGIDPDTILVGGPYVVINTWGTSEAGGFPATEPLLQNKTYGTYDQRDLDVIKYWLHHKAGAGFITYTGRNGNRGLEDLGDPYTANDKFSDMNRWIRSLDNTAYPGAQTLPIFVSEWYSTPYGTTDRAYNNAVKANAVIKFLKSGGKSTLSWGGVENTELWNRNPSMYTNVDTASGGQPLPWYYSFRAFRDYFPPGTGYLATTQTTNDITVLASAAKTMLVNKKAANVVVSVNGVVVTLAPYEVRIIDTPEQISPTPTLRPTPTKTPTLRSSSTPTRTPPPDTTSPIVTITNPANNSTVKRNSTVTITANASDNVGVVRVVFSITSKTSTTNCTDLAAPYTCNWLVPGKARTTYTITATAYDAAGNSGRMSIKVTSSR
jgi:hypothetical protein